MNRVWQYLVEGYSFMNLESASARIAFFNREIQLTSGLGELDFWPDEERPDKNGENQPPFDPR